MKAKGKVNAFCPKELVAGGQEVRATQCGALLSGHFKKFYHGQNDVCQILWEVPWPEFLSRRRLLRSSLSALCRR